MGFLDRLAGKSAQQREEEERAAAAAAAAAQAQQAQQAAASTSAREILRDSSPGFSAAGQAHGGAACPGWLHQLGGCITPVSGVSCEQAWVRRMRGRGC
jgi:hypothetical protein